MPTFLIDTFTESVDTTLASHTPETGGTWTKHPSYADTITIDAVLDHIYGAGGADFAVYYNTASPAGADYSVSGDVFVLSVAASYPGVAGRMNTAANTMYRAYYRQEITAWRLDKVVAGIVATLGADYTQVLTVSQTYTLRLDLIGDQIKVYVDGVERISDTDSAITAAGKAGVVQYANSGQQLTSVTAVDSGAAGVLVAHQAMRLGVGHF